MFDKIFACNLVCGLEFLTNFAKNHLKIVRFYDFQPKIDFCFFFVYIVSDCEYFQIFEGVLTL